MYVFVDTSEPGSSSATGDTGSVRPQPGGGAASSAFPARRRTSSSSTDLSYADVTRLMDEVGFSSLQRPLEPPGTVCALLLVRFPDSVLPQFRLSVQIELQDPVSHLASVAALAPQPFSGFEQSKSAVTMQWPSRTAVALLVFDGTEGATDWLRGLGTKGDTWQYQCEAVVVRGLWIAPKDDRPTFTVTSFQTKPTAKRQQIMDFTANTSPKITRLRREHGGVKVAATREVKNVVGRWFSEHETVAVTYWPHADRCFAYRERLKTDQYPVYLEEFMSLFDSYSVLIVSEDLSLLNSPSAGNRDQYRSCTPSLPESHTHTQD